ncbi:YbaB/EbfC family nucleoid-associated protein [Spirillospora sp. NPDC048819]|uniref:YbaB/EbfC family nucleoid-associated protein n=1 Tax=Spirillospora sp. NPDC048819 TaxID=3155268 RepID=UPI0033FDCAA8
MTRDTAADDLNGLLQRVSGFAEQAGGPCSEPPPEAVEGHDPDGLVTVRVTAGGRIDRVSVAPRALRLGSHEIADRAAAAINAALDALEQATAGAGAAGPADLTERLGELRNQSLTQMRAYVTSMQNLMNGFERH